MSINFPDSPSVNDTHTVGDKTWTWDGTAWNVVVGGVPTSISELSITNDLTVGGENVTPYTGRRNLLYNGAMQVAQRGTSVSSQYVSDYYTVDRWQWFSNATGARWDMAQDTDAPDGFSNSWKITCSQALASPASGDYYQVSQRLEGYDIQHLAKGLSNAKQVTLSFWVKSNVTGTYIARLLDQNNRAIHRSYTVNTVNTWEYKTLTYAGDTSGTITSANTEGWRLTFWLGSGSNYNSGTLQTSWGSYVPANSAVGQTNLASAVNNYWQVTGVQLEVGDKATPFEHRSYGEELALCQRYYQRHVIGGAYFPIAAAIGSTNGLIQYSLPVTMRATPTLTASSGALLRPLSTGGSVIGTTDSTSVAWYSTATPYGGQVYFSGSSGLTAGTAIGVYVNTYGGGWLEFNGAEL